VTDSLYEVLRSTTLVQAHCPHLDCRFLAVARSVAAAIAAIGDHITLSHGGQVTRAVQTA